MLTSNFNNYSLRYVWMQKMDERFFSIPSVIKRTRTSKLFSSDAKLTSSENEEKKEFDTPFILKRLSGKHFL